MSHFLRFLGLLPIIFFTFCSEASVCGLRGSVRDRLSDCAAFNGARKGQYLVVTRMIGGREILLDIKTQTLWSPSLEGKFSQFKAIEACATKRPEFADIQEVTWSLPTADDYSYARKNGLQKTYTGGLNQEWFWSQTVVPFDGLVAYVYDGSSGDIAYHNRNGKMSARCVGR